MANDEGKNRDPFALCRLPSHANPGPRDRPHPMVAARAGPENRVQHPGSIGVRGSGLEEVTLRTSMYLRCALAGLLGGFIMVTTPQYRMFWQGVALILVGAVSLTFWIKKLGDPEWPRRRRDRP